ncbi:alpha/beta-hydrolase, partial [Polyporus arcularius HHB13444]
VGDLRLRLPKPILGYNGTINATQPATQCIQINPGIRKDMPVEMLQDMGAYLPAATGTGPDVPQDEDCLGVTVQIPCGTPPNAKLPVSFSIYGGGFATGSSVKFLGDALVTRSIASKQPVIYVVFNHRLNTFGFLGGKEIKEAGVGNLGLHDQRLALKWVNKYISAFGGHLSDSIPPLFVPSEVTDFVIQFTATLDLNGIPNQTVQWPKYDLAPQADPYARRWRA